jgi:hypothetical protein
MNNEKKEPRSFVLKLTDSEAKELYEKAGVYGLTPSGLLEGFIADLINGQYSNGSDERGLANTWIERAYNSPYKVFTQWLLESGNMNYFYDCYKAKVEAEADLEDLKEESDSAPQELEDLQSEIRYQEDNLEDLYNDFSRNEDYMKAGKELDFESALEWYKGKERFIERTL